MSNWEKSSNSEFARLNKKGGRWKFLVGGALIIAAIGYLVIASTLNGAAFFITVDEVVNDPDYVGQEVRLSGAVIGDTIMQETQLISDRQTNVITFTISHIPQEFDNLAEALHQSVSNPQAARLQVVYEGAMPDLLQHEAQAILTGAMGADGVFYANELLLKCPSRFEDGGSSDHLGEDHPGMERINIDAG